MITKVQLLRNIGKFHNVSSGAKLPFKRLTLIHAENGRGKTTLSTVLRSLATNNPTAITQRKRFDSLGEPHAIITISGMTKPIKFKNDVWSMKAPSIMVFDDSFVEDNVYSGLNISPQQRQGLHDVILGAEAVRFQYKLEQQIEVVKRYMSEIATLRKALKPNIPDGFGLDKFCSLSSVPDLDNKIELAERNLNAARQTELISKLPPFESLSLPQYDLIAIEVLLNETLDTLGIAALRQVEQHIASLGEGAERWIDAGVAYAPAQDDQNSLCPFCGQEISGSVLIQHYRAYFSESYSALKKRISELRNMLDVKFGLQLNAALQGKLRSIADLQRRWSQFLPVKLDPPDADVIFQDCKLALDSIQALLNAKQSSPLEGKSITEQERKAVTGYEEHLVGLVAFNEQLTAANSQIDCLKTTIASSSLEDLTRKLSLLKAIRIRYEPLMAKRCGEYRCMNDDKAKAEQSRNKIRAQLNKYREDIFPRFGDKVNRLLKLSGAGFEIAELKPVNRSSGSSTTYGTKIGNTTIDLSATKSDSDPSFGTVLSAGDRTILAFAFFLASVSEISNLEETTVVIDDPISSLDTGRNTFTVQEIRSLVGSANQVIVLSHSKSFLCRIAEPFNRNEYASIEIKRASGGSDFAQWDLTEESLTEHDMRDQQFRKYLEHGSGDKPKVAFNLRLHLEGFLRVACPQHLCPGDSLGGQFRQKVRATLGGPEQILSKKQLVELNHILEYANLFHHDTNPNWKKQTIDDTELQTFVQRTLEFTTP